MCFIKAIGIGLYVLAVLAGLWMILVATVLGIGGSSVERILGGLGCLLLGIVYVTPVLAFSRKLWILIYASVAVFATIVFLVSIIIDDKRPSLIVYVTFAMLLLACPITLALIAFLLGKEKRCHRL